MVRFQEVPYLKELVYELGLATERIGADPVHAVLFVLGTIIVAFVFSRLLAPPYYQNIAGPPSPSFIYGHLENLYSPHGLHFHDDLQNTYGSLIKIKGLFGSEQLYISDPRAVQEILVKENDATFRHPQFVYDFHSVCFGPSLGSTYGAIHKAQRKMLNPIFATRHMIALTPKFNDIAQELKGAISNSLKGSASKDLDMLYWCSATALELIGQAGVGHKFGLFQGIESAYSRAIKELLPSAFELSPYRALLCAAYKIRPHYLRGKIAEWTPSATIRRLKNAIDIQDQQAKVILDKKKKDLRNGSDEEQLDDIISILLKANTEATESDRLPEDQLLGQMNMLIFAGHETTSGAIARALHLLSMHPGIQNRLRDELQTASPTLDYNELNSLEYLDAFCRELLRIYAPVPMIQRQALRDWVVPLRYPVKAKDGQELREIKIKKGTQIYLAIREANRNHETWGQDADEFRPERWLKTLPSSVTEAKTSGVYSSMMTFSAGPRACIGFKFSLLELKIVLSTLVKSFKFAPGETPIEWHLGFTMSPFEAGAKHPAMPLNVSAV